MVKVGIVGASGYSGLELLRLLRTHSHVEVGFVTSRSMVGKKLVDFHPSAAGVYDDLVFSTFDAAKAGEADVVFIALPHGAALDAVAEIDLDKVKVIDLSGDLRLPRDVYETWYKREHHHPGLLQEAVYGLTEFNREKIKKAALVSNPGCYPTSVALAVIPLLKSGAIGPEMMVSSVSGVSGAGRLPSGAVHFCQVDENVAAYKIGGVHQHIPEMEQAIVSYSGVQSKLSFTPHLGPYSRGILSTIYAKSSVGSTDELLEILKNSYDSEPFVQVLESGKSPQTKSVAGTNFCHIGAALDVRTGTATIISAIDNLGKGAAGQAIQNMNLMFGLEETTGLISGGIFP